MSHLLTLHAGALRVHPDALPALVTPPPTKSKTGRDFVPIPHAEFRTQILRACEVSNLSIVEEEHAVWGGETGADRYFCAFALKALQEDYQLVIGGRNSHDHAFAAAACLGSRVFICDNLAFSAEITFRVLHTKNIRTTLEKKAQEAIAQIAHRRANLDAQISHFKESPVDPDPLKLALISLVRRHRVLSMTDLNPLLDAWESGSYNVRGKTPQETDADAGLAVPLGHTAWDLYNLITNHLKGLSPDTLQKRTIHLHQSLVSLTGAPTAPPIPSAAAADPELPDERPESNDPSSGPVFDPADDPARLGPPDEPPFGA